MVSSPKAYTEQISNVSVVYNVYRIVLPLVLLVTYISSRETSQLGVLAPNLFVQINTVCAINGVIITFFTPGSRTATESTRPYWHADRRHFYYYPVDLHKRRGRQRTGSVHYCDNRIRQHHDLGSL